MKIDIIVIFLTTCDITSLLAVVVELPQRIIWRFQPQLDLLLAPNVIFFTDCPRRVNGFSVQTLGIIAGGVLVLLVAANDFVQIDRVHYLKFN